MPSGLLPLIFSDIALIERFPLTASALIAGRDCGRTWRLADLGAKQSMLLAALGSRRFAGRAQPA